MSVYGDLSKAQRRLLTALFYGIPDGRAVLSPTAVRARAQSAVSIETALLVDRKGRQTAANLKARGFVEHTDAWRPRVWLTPAGVELMDSLDFRHAR